MIKKKNKTKQPNKGGVPVTELLNTRTRQSNKHRLDIFSDEEIKFCSKVIVHEIRGTNLGHPINCDISVLKSVSAIYHIKVQVLISGEKDKGLYAQK